MNSPHSAIDRSVIVGRDRSKLGFGPYALFEAVPWLMFATAMRGLAYNSPLALVFFLFAQVATFLAFLLAARRMIEASGGATTLDRLNFRQQLAFARSVLWPIFVIIFIAMAIAGMAGFTEHARHFLMGFDGVAFDQYTDAGRAFSAVLAAVAYLCVLQKGTGREPNIRTVGAELWRRLPYFLAAIAISALFLLLFTKAQVVGRALVGEFVQTSALPQVKNLVFFFFIFVFATVRMWVLLAILTVATRASYRNDGA